MAEDSQDFMNPIILYLFIVVVFGLVIMYIVKRIQLVRALETMKKMLEEHEEKVFIEETKKIKNRNFLEKATNGKDDRV